MSNGTRHFVLDQIALAVGLVASRPLVPSLCSEIIAELRDIAAPAAVITTVDHAARFMPVEDRFEKSLLGKLNHNVCIIEAYLRGSCVAIDEQECQLRPHIIALALQKFSGKIVTPQPAPHLEIQLVRKKEI